MYTQCNSNYPCRWKLRSLSFVTCPEVIAVLTIVKSSVTEDFLVSMNICAVQRQTLLLIPSDFKRNFCH